MLAALILERALAIAFVPVGAVRVPLLATSPVVWTGHVLANLIIVPRQVIVYQATSQPTWSGGVPVWSTSILSRPSGFDHTAPHSPGVQSTDSIP